MTAAKPVYAHLLGQERCLRKENKRTANRRTVLIASGGGGVGVGGSETTFIDLK